MFDAKAWIAAHEPPTYIDTTGAQHTGRLWSHVEYLKWLKAFESWQDGSKADDEYEGELRKLLASMGFTDPVVTEMLALPSVALEEMVKGFFVLQRANGTRTPSTTESPIPSNLEPSGPTTGPASAPSVS